MDILLLGVVAVILAAMIFDYTNGFHDAANAIATSVSTRALTPRVALLIAAIARAARGVRARVEMLVAMAFAASWKPFV